VKEYAKERGCYDSVVCSVEGFILETGHSNLFWIKGNNLYTPDSSLPLLSGVSLSVVKDAAAKLGMEVHEVKVSLDEIPSDANVYISNAIIGYHPVTSIDGRQYPIDNPQTFQEAFETILNDPLS